MSLVYKFSYFVKQPNLTLPLAWLLPVAVIRLHIGGLHAVGCGEGP